MGKMSVFISQPMNKIPEEEITGVREGIINFLNKGDILDEGDYAEAIPNVKRPDAPANAGRIWYLAQSLIDLEKADLTIFAPGWQSAAGCLVEHLVCEVYKLPYIDFDEEWLK